MKNRVYSCPYCAITFSARDELKAHMVTVHKTQPLPKPEGQIDITVNGQRHEIKVEPQWTLFQVVHDTLGLTGVKLFCDRGACGACTVIMNGRPILSCMTLAAACDGAVIETAEGIAQAEHPIVENYVKHHCMQCGYCTPGFVVTSKALLDRNPNPSEDDIKHALAGNLCRCGTYPQHTKAVLDTAKELTGTKKGDGQKASRGEVGK